MKKKLGKKGVDVPEWIYIIALVLGLVAIAIFVYLLFQARGVQGGVFGDIEGFLGI